MTSYQKLIAVSVLTLLGGLGDLWGLGITDSKRMRADERVAGTSEPVATLRPADNPTLEVMLADGRILTLNRDGTTASILEATTRRHARSYHLHDSRSHASMTVLPSGRVLIWGGVNQDGHVFGDGISFDPYRETFNTVRLAGLIPRAGHSATVLMDGTLLIAGGVGVDGRLVAFTERWQERDKTVRRLDAPQSAMRIRHRAELTDRGAVQLSGGVNEQGQSLTTEAVLPFPESASDLPDHDDKRPKGFAVARTYPAHRAERVVTTTTIGLQLTQPLDAAQLAQGSVALVGPNGMTPVTLTPAGSGRLLFVSPREPLLPESDYALVANRLKSTTGKRLPVTTLEFKTAPLNPELAGSAVTATTARNKAYGCGNGDKLEPCNPRSKVEDGVWTPGKDNTQGRWRLYSKKFEILPNLALEQSLKGSDRTVLTGRIAQIDEKPVAGVTVKLGSKATTTNANGEFILYDIPSGRQEVFVDGSTANRLDAEYGQFVAGVDIRDKTLTQLPYTMYVSKIAARDKVKIRSPLIKDTVLTHPAMPGLEVLIPAGTVIRDRKGALVTELALVPTPVNRAPFPVTVNFPMYFTIEPGGAVVQGLTAANAKGIRVSYPNYDGRKPSDRSHFWIYDPAKGWQVYGKGHLSSDRSRFVADRGVALHRMTGGAFTIDDNDPPTEPDLPEDGDECGCNGSGGVANAGDPIDLKTGAFTYTKTDVVIRDVIPIVLSRSYRTHDTAVRTFGRGTIMNYGLTLYTSPDMFYDTVTLKKPNGSGVVFERIGPRPANGVYRVSKWKSTSIGGEFLGATIETVTDSDIPSESNGFKLTKQGGSIIFFDSTSANSYGVNRIRYIRDKFGHQVSFSYDAGFLSRVTSPSGRYIDFSYDTQNRISTVTDFRGRVWSYTYSPEDLLTRVTYPDTTHEDIAYDKTFVDLGTQPFWIHRIKFITNRRGFQELLNTYESPLDITLMLTSYRVVKQTRADTGEINIQYNHFNGTNYGTLVTEPDGSQRRVHFGTWRYPASDTLAYGTPKAQTFTFERDANSQRLTARIDALGRRTEYQYDANGNATQVKSLAGTANQATVNMTYTSEGQLTSVTNPLNEQSVFSYQNRCLSSATDPLGHSTSISCNGDGLPEQITNALGKTTYLFYDKGLLIASVDAMNRATGYAYDTLGRLIVVRDPQGRILRRYYDTNDRVIRQIDPSGAETQIGYDANGNVSAVLKPHGNGITYAYDSRDRLITRTDSLNQADQWTYDTMDRVATYTDRMQRLTQFAYDELGRLTTTTYHDGSAATRTYDAGNRMLSLSDTSAGSLTWGYDGFDRVTSESGAQGSVSYGYDAAGRRTTMTPATQTQIVYDYDAAGRLVEIQQGTEVVGYIYDDANRLTQLTLPNGVKTGYAYNDTNQITGIAYLKADNTALGNLGYGYDSAGRQVAQTGSFASNLLPPATTANSTFDDNHRQTSWNGQAISYDANGNMLSDGARTYHWNVRNQLIEIRQGGTTIASFAYDAVGRRVGRTEAGATTSYLYDGLNAVQETQGAVANPVLTGLGIDERFARNDAGGRSYFLRDLLGSTRALTSSAGNVVQRYDYSPYGDSTQTSTSFSNPYLYTGRERDASGVYYYRARYYNTGMGRFISEDPISLAGGLNTYAYVSGKTLEAIDPLGLWSLTASGYIPLILDGPIGPGGGIQITGIGLDIESLSFRGGIGAGAGIGLNPFGTPPDQNHMDLPCGLKQGIGVYLDGSASIGYVGGGLEWNYGGTRSIGPNGTHWQEYGGLDTEIEVGPRIGTGAQIGVGIELTQYF